MWIPRRLQSKILETASSRPALLLTGVRQAGKSALLKKLFPDAAYITLDRRLAAESAEGNPRGFLQQFAGEATVVIDEVQNAPSIFPELKIRIDEERGRHGAWILTGSQKFPLMKRAGESLAGRIALLNLETLSAEELRSAPEALEVADALWKGGFPETWTNTGMNIADYFESYLETYLERDLRSLMQIAHLRDFRRMLRACAIRAGSLVNYADIARDIGVSQATIKSWIGLLESSGILVLLEPYFANLGKRLTKAPKLYLTDQGLLCSLLAIHSADELERHVHQGAVWENFVFTELLKSEHVVSSRNFFFYRDHNLVEIDFLVERGNELLLIEAKAGTVPDRERLNFAKVVPLFPGRRVRCILACGIEEPRPVPLKDYVMLNPLRHKL